MKLQSKLDDLCGDCGHSWATHADSACVETPYRPMLTDECACMEFVPPLVARLVDGLEGVAREAWGGRYADVPIDASTGAQKTLLDLLVECGRMTKDGEVYRWKQP